MSTAPTTTEPVWVHMNHSHTCIRKTYILLYCAFSCFFVLFVLFEGKKVTMKSTCLLFTSNPMYFSYFFYYFFRDFSGENLNFFYFFLLFCTFKKKIIFFYFLLFYSDFQKFLL